MTGRELQYSDYLARLFPGGSAEDMHINGSHPMEITFQVTEDCNMRCSYCYQHGKSKNHMDFETARKAVDMILAADGRTNKYLTSTKARGVVLAFIGGEPFLEIELIDRICDYFIEQCFRLRHPWATRYAISLTTNGLLYFDPGVQAFIRKHQGKFHMAISVDGCRELHDACRLDLAGNGTYDRAMAGVRHYVEHWKGRMGSKMTLCPENIGYCAEAVRNLVENGYTHINMNCVYEEGWTPEHGRTLYEQCKKIAEYFSENELYDRVYVSLLDEDIGRALPEAENNNWCGGTGLMLCVNWQGKFYPCVRYEESSLGRDREPYVIGDIKTGIMNTPEYDRRVQCLSCITRRSQSTDECFGCPIARGCAWCTAYNYEITGSPDKRLTYICVMHKARVLGANYFWNTMYRDKGQKRRIPLKIPKDWAVEIISEDEFEMLCALSESGGEKECRE